MNFATKILDDGRGFFLTQSREEIFVRDGLKLNETFVRRHRQIQSREEIFRHASTDKKLSCATASSSMKRS